MSNLFRIAFLVFSFVFIASLPASSDDNGIAGVLHTLQPERGRLCMDGHFHFGSSNSQRSIKAATYAAVNDWRSFVAFEYGSDWTNFNRAANRIRNCQPQGRGLWRCSVEARPCR